MYRQITCLLACSLALVGLGCAPASPSGGERQSTETAADTVAQEGTGTTLVEDFRNTDLGCELEHVGSMELRYARCFTIDYFEGGYQLACLRDGQRYLFVPLGREAPEGLASDIMVIEQPVGDVYLVASDTMCLFDALDALDCISVSGVERDDWYLPSARAAMDAGDIVYGGKYRAPDYELLLSRGVRLAVENTMINHTPEVREKLIELGIPVVVELSSYESEPLARCEWVRFFGALLGKDELALERFEEQVSEAEGVKKSMTGKTVAFFYLNSNGAAVVRRPGDYVTKMIEQAGGVSAFSELDEATVGSSSVTLQMEQFYAMAKDADVLIYNGSIDDSVDSLDALVAKNPLLDDFKAVGTGDVWVTEQNMYQQMMASGQIIADINCALTGSTDDLTYLQRLE